MKIVGNLFDNALGFSDDPLATENQLESSAALYWIAAMYWKVVNSENHGVWDSSTGNDSWDSISQHNKIDSDTTYYIQCNATDREFKVIVHDLGKVFELTEYNGSLFRIVFRLIDRPNPDAIWDGFDFKNKIVVDRIDGDEAELRRHLVHLKLSGATPSFEVIG